MKKSSKQNGTNTSKKGKVKSLEEALDKAIAAPRKDAKVKVNAWIDADVVEALMAEAEETGGKYQTLMNRYLRAAVLKEVSRADIKAIKIALAAV